MPKHLGEELRARSPFVLDEPFLTYTRVHYQAQCQWQVSLAGEIPNLLRNSLFLEDEVVPGEVVDQPALLITNRRQNVDDRDVNGDGGFALVLSHSSEEQAPAKGRCTKRRENKPLLA